MLTITTLCVVQSLFGVVFLIWELPDVNKTMTGPSEPVLLAAGGPVDPSSIHKGCESHLEKDVLYVHLPGMRGKANRGLGQIFFLNEEDNSRRS